MAPEAVWVSASASCFITVYEGVKSIVCSVPISHSTVPVRLDGGFSRYVFTSACVPIGWLGICDCIQSALLIFLVLSYAKVIFLPLLKGN